MQSITQAEDFYKTVLDVLLKKHVHFMVGGTYAFSAYTNIIRSTKDIDIFTPLEEYPQVLKVCAEAGFETELLDPKWIAKVKKDKHFVDIIFSERNGLHIVSTTWLKNARKGNVLGRKVLLMPVEQMIRSKIYLQFRDKYDGADVNHLILLYGKSLDWHWLLTTLDVHWLLLFSQLLLFCFVYPSERDSIPTWLMQELFYRTVKEFSGFPIADKITRGLLISHEYKVSIEKWGFKPIQDMK